MYKAEILQTQAGPQKYYPLHSLAEKAQLDRLPFSIRILLEAAVRNQDGFSVLPKDIDELLHWKSKADKPQEIAFKPGRVILQDFTGVPALVDLAALRSAMARCKGDPKKINPQVKVDLVIDHSVQVDYFGNKEALQKNMQREFERNHERYEFLKWGEDAFSNLRIIPPGLGIVHQINLEYLATLVLEREQVLYPDSLVGTDSHTTMINGLGILAWGVGGIEAEAVMLGQPIYMLVPEVVGLRLDGNLSPGVTATDLVLAVTQQLREHGVVGKFVEFFGPGLDKLSLPDRATIANMAPEYGATCGYFPVDKESLNYLDQTGRDKEQIQRVADYFKAQGLFRTDESPDPEYSDSLELDLAQVQPCIAGPLRPQDRITLQEAKSTWQKTLQMPIKERGFALDAKALQAAVHIKNGSEKDPEILLKHGSVVIAAITSCTNTSNPELMLCAGLLAKKAVERGLQVRSYIKTSLAPGSRVVSDYLEQADLNPYLEKLGFHTVGYGCTTCIGNSGPLPGAVLAAIQKEQLVAAAVLSGNRNFEGRISPHVKANFLASPPLVVAYALAGTMEIDLSSEPIGKDKSNADVFLKDIWPSQAEVRALLEGSIKPEMYNARYAKAGAGAAGELWEAIPVKREEIYEWKNNSTYIQEPDFFTDMPMTLPPLAEIKEARCLLKVGDSVTTDHISPAGAIPEAMPAGQYLLSKGVAQKDFNSFGSRRGNDQIMTRGTFGNIRLRNQLAPGTEGGLDLPPSQWRANADLRSQPALQKGRGTLDCFSW